MTPCNPIYDSFPNDAIEASDGTVYFSDTSSKFGFDEWYFDVLEARPHGRLLKYDPATMETSIVLDGLAFANGVALSKDEEFLLISETWKYVHLLFPPFLAISLTFLSHPLSFIFKFSFWTGFEF